MASNSNNWDFYELFCILFYLCSFCDNLDNVVESLSLTYLYENKHMLRSMWAFEHTEIAHVIDISLYSIWLVQNINWIFVLIYYLAPIKSITIMICVGCSIPCPNAIEILPKNRLWSLISIYVYERDSVCVCVYVCMTLNINWTPLERTKK